MVGDHQRDEMKTESFQVKASDASYVTAPLTRGTSSQRCDVSNTSDRVFDGTWKCRPGKAATSSQGGCVAVAD